MYFHIFVSFFGCTEVTDSPLFLQLLSDLVSPLSETPIELFTATYLFLLNFRFNTNFFALRILK